MASCKAILRQWCSELVSVIVRQGEALLPGNLEEIGESSAVVLMDHSIRTGTPVTIACRARKFNGIVQSFTCDEHLGFFVEILFEPGSHWSPRWFYPRHLLPPMQPKQSKVFSRGAA